MEAIDTDWQTPTGLPLQGRLDRGVDEDFEAYRRGTQYSDFARTWFEETAGDEGWPFLLGTEKDHGT